MAGCQRQRLEAVGRPGRTECLPPSHPSSSAGCPVRCPWLGPRFLRGQLVCQVLVACSPLPACPHWWGGEAGEKGKGEGTVVPAKRGLCCGASEPLRGGAVRLAPGLCCPGSCPPARPFPPCPLLVCLSGRTWWVEVGVLGLRTRILSGGGPMCRTSPRPPAATTRPSPKLR